MATNFQIDFSPRSSRAAIERELRTALSQNPRDLLQLLEGQSDQEWEFEGSESQDTEGEESQGGEGGEGEETEPEESQGRERAASNQSSNERRKFQDISLEELRRAVWLEKVEIKDWIPLDEPLKLHFLRTCLLWNQLSTSPDPIPIIPRPNELASFGFKKLEEKEPMSPSNIQIDWGCGGKE